MSPLDEILYDIVWILICTTNLLDGHYRGWRWMSYFFAIMIGFWLTYLNFDIQAYLKSN